MHKLPKFSRRVAVFGVYGTIINQQAGLKPAPIQALINTFEQVGIPNTPLLESLIVQNIEYRGPLRVARILYDENMFDYKKYLCDKYGCEHVAVTEIHEEFIKQQYNILCMPEYTILAENFNELVKLMRSKGVQYVCLTTDFTKIMMLPVLNSMAKQGFKPTYYVSTDIVEPIRIPPCRINAICKFTGYEIHKCFKVGGTVNDISEAELAGCYGVGLVNDINNVISKDRLLRFGAKYVINDLFDLNILLEEHNEKYPLK